VYATRAVIVTLLTVAAVSIPNFGLFLSLVGSIGGSMISYVLPALFHQRLVKCTMWLKVLDWFLVVFGLVIGAALSAAITIMGIVDEYRHAT